MSPMCPGATPAQTVGPYFSLGLGGRPFSSLPATLCVRLKGYVLDGAGAPVPDALLEVWTPAGPRSGFFRMGVAADGSFEFPCWDASLDERAVQVHVMARGVLETLITVVWREDCAPQPDSPRWLGIPAARRDTLRARKVGTHYQWNIRLSGGAGAGETVFLDPAD